MAIYSLQHRFVGRSGPSACKPGFAAAHARYIMRPWACFDVLGRVPEPYRLTRSSFSAALLDGERGDRVNARVCDRLIIALPRELGPAGYAEAVREFADEMKLDRVIWVAAIHALGDDAENPHAHIIVRDRGADGERVLKTTERGSTERFRVGWELAANRVLERRGHDARIDRRSLDAQGIAGPAQIHVGPNAHKMHDKGLASERFDQNEAIKSAQKIVRDLELLEDALDEVNREIAVSRGAAAELTPIDVLSTQLDQISDEAHAHFGPEPVPPRSVEERIREHPTFELLGADVVVGEVGAKYEREFASEQKAYDREHTLWTAAESVLSAVVQVSQSVEAIATAGVRAVWIALDRTKTFKERFEGIAQVVRETITELGERYDDAAATRDLDLRDPESVGTVAIVPESPLASLFSSAVNGTYQVVVRRGGRGEVREGALLQLQPDGNWSSVELDRTQLRAVLSEGGLQSGLEVQARMDLGIER